LLLSRDLSISSRFSSFVHLVSYSLLDFCGISWMSPFSSLILFVSYFFSCLVYLFLSFESQLFILLIFCGFFQFQCYWFLLWSLLFLSFY
jgi:hypothetical protein